MIGMTVPSFPEGFVWGVSTSAFQIEGATAEGGRGPSVWDTFTATPGKVARGEDARVTADHYHRYAEDVALMSQLGVDAYRMSFAWPRIQPTGSGPANAEGLAFYDRLLDAVCEAGIDPVGTLYHWDTPQALEDAGGWLSRDTAARFADYAALVGERFADRVKMWIPLNEPMVMSIFGYGIGEYAPGRALLLDALPTAHHQLLAHGLAVSALRAAGAASIGTANNHSPIWGEGEGEAAAFLDALINRLFADPILLGSYPEVLHGRLPDGFADDLPVIAAPLDFYGVNYYEPMAATTPTAPGPLPFELRPVEGYPMTTNDSPVVPDALRELLVTMHERYPGMPPVHITENGCSFDGIHDRERIDFLTGHLTALREAMDAGVDVRGYFFWSLIDNFEWSKGYAPRFGLVHIDYDTLARTPKDSFHWYRDLIKRSR
ncbi:beta-glucosidase [Saccharopolyspora erythraea D]|nr:beta-glucosidase [Saccharopolyspora erythraea D]